MGARRRAAVAGLRSDDAECFARRPAVRRALSFSQSYRARRRFPRRLAPGSRPQGLSPFAAFERHLPYGLLGDQGRKSVLRLIQNRQMGVGNRSYIKLLLDEE